MAIGDQIRNIRLEHHLSQQALADQLHISRQSVSKWETGSAQPSFDNIVSISDQFGVSLDDLLRADLTLLAALRQQDQQKERRVFWLGLPLATLLLTLPLVLTHTAGTSWLPDLLGLAGATLFLWAMGRVQRQPLWAQLPRGLKWSLWLALAFCWLPILINGLGGFLVGLGSH
ncbi:helix-turn-helix domain-containing protein [Lacticaseibacillus mingshuiensis]|uniref:helix-turn-helix domain-containing protein n=1 Tax=Lacticaseibacillus mingshuiensis TaxID=2799574 RepID=UPI0019506C72|nr:helix-turn-helix transcriptional regulator [Lacticaseibacillus mingshuiensis]